MSKIKIYWQYPGNVPPPSKPEDSIFCKTVNSYGKINIHSVISISLTQTISGLILVVGRCQDIADLFIIVYKQRGTICIMHMVKQQINYSFGFSLIC